MEVVRQRRGAAGDVLRRARPGAALRRLRRPRPAPAGRTVGRGRVDRRRCCSRWRTRPACSARSRSGAAAGRQQVLPTARYETWRRRHRRPRWRQLASAWLTMTRQAGLVGQRDDRDRLINALAPEATRPAAPAAAAGRARRAGRPAGRARRPTAAEVLDCWPGGPPGAAGGPARAQRVRGGARRGRPARRHRAGRAHLLRPAAAGRGGRADDLDDDDPLGRAERRRRRAVGRGRRAGRAAARPGRPLAGAGRPDAWWSPARRSRRWPPNWS